nr:CrcB family protein [Leifsonia psychrotolerans]
MRWGSIALVGLGGTVGTLARETISLLVPSFGAFSIAIPLINLAGAFLLGFLYEALTRVSPREPRATRLRLLLGTGFCGGFTTYSALATDAAVLNSSGNLVLAVAILASTVVFGAVATWLGIAVGARVSRPRPSAPSAGTAAP